ncbi:MAG: hypothetical protein BRC29_03785 [Nanohaloarchaea archaeon SW_7_43_1]|nr:MAG: hypothetical protein BRC29_03785 [Nanohaloarchaea archaeon SW_7_43_1]
MSNERQAKAYLREAELTLESAKAIYRSSEKSGEKLWAQVVKNGYDAIEQAISAGIAKEDEVIPRDHPSMINTFIELYGPEEDIEELLLHWLQLRSNTQYVDIRGDEINIPHKQFTQEDAQQILEDIETILKYIREQIR